jgi:hypothetical protein
MRNLLSVIGALVAVSSAIPYIANTMRGQTRPNTVSWLTWMFLHVIATFAAFSSGAIQTAIFTSAAALSTGVIAAISLRFGVRRYTRFDMICQLLSVVGLGIWLLTDKPLFAMIIVMAVNLIAALPTIRHAWNEPDRETWQTFALSVIASTITLVAIAQYNFISLAYPIYFFACDGAIAVVILTRRHASKSARQTQSAPILPG